MQGPSEATAETPLLSFGQIGFWVPGGLIGKSFPPTLLPTEYHYKKNAGGTCESWIAEERSLQFRLGKRSLILALPVAVAATATESHQQLSVADADPVLTL